MVLLQDLGKPPDFVSRRTHRYMSPEIPALPRCLQGRSPSYSRTAAGRTLDPPHNVAQPGPLVSFCDTIEGTIPSEASWCCESVSDRPKQEREASKNAFHFSSLALQQHNSKVVAQDSPELRS